MVNENRNILRKKWIKCQSLNVFQSMYCLKEEFEYTKGLKLNINPNLWSSN